MTILRQFRLYKLGETPVRFWTNAPPRVIAKRLRPTWTEGTTLMDWPDGPVPLGGKAEPVAPIPPVTGTPDS